MPPQRDRLVEVGAADGEPVGHRRGSRTRARSSRRRPRRSPGRPTARRASRAPSRGRRRSAGARRSRRPEANRRVARADPGEGLDRVEVHPVVGGVVRRVDEDVVGRPDRSQPSRSATSAAASMPRARQLGEVGKGESVAHRRIVAKADGTYSAGEQPTAGGDRRTVLPRCHWLLAARRETECGGDSGSRRRTSTALPADSPVPSASTWDHRQSDRGDG